MDEKNIRDAKRQLRQKMFKIRGDMPDDRRHAANQAISERLVDFLSKCPPGVFAGFWPLMNEVDLRDAMGRLEESGWTNSLPRMLGGGQPLDFHKYCSGDVLVEGAFGVMEPGRQSDIVSPLVIAVPLLAYDQRGFRLGYGGGFYDRTLERLAVAEHDVTTIGVAFSELEVETVPIGDHDRPLNMIMSDSNTYFISETNI